MKKILSLLVAVMMMLACAVPAFAEDGDDDTPSVVRIPEGTKVVTSSTLDDGIIDRLEEQGARGIMVMDIRTCRMHA